MSHMTEMIGLLLCPEILVLMIGLHASFSDFEKVDEEWAEGNESKVAYGIYI